MLQFCHAYLKWIFLGITAGLALTSMAFAQGATPTLLHGPADWRFEQLPIPPGFAPDIKWTGFEEARFAPGMFSTTSSNYFTYVLAVTVTGTPEIGSAELKDFLDKYFRGLSIGVGRRKQLKPDPTQFNAEVTALEAKPGTPKKYTAKLPFFDTFNDGRKISLNVEITVVPRTESKKTYVVLLISPLGNEAETWKKLREIGDGLKFEEK